MTYKQLKAKLEENYSELLIRYNEWKETLRAVLYYQEYMERLLETYAKQRWKQKY